MDGEAKTRGDSLSDLNPYAASTNDAFEATYCDEGADVDSLDVSQRWKRRFHLIKASGGAENIGFGKSGFNVLGFFFGPLYYLSKGMWKKAIGLFAMMVGINIAFGIAMLFLSVPPDVDRVLGLLLSLGFSITFALRANIDYYKRKVLGDKAWW